MGTAGNLVVWATVRREPEFAVRRPLPTLQPEKPCPVDVDFWG